MGTFTQLTKTLLDLNQETRQKLSSMPSFTEQEMKRLEALLKETEQKVNDCENAFLVVSLHLQLLKAELIQRLKENTLKG
jgi:hypothetical protein